MLMGTRSMCMPMVRRRAGAYLHSSTHLWLLLYSYTSGCSYACGRYCATSHPYTANAATDPIAAGCCRWRHSSSPLLPYTTPTSPLWLPSGCCAERRRACFLHKLATCTLATESHLHAQEREYGGHEE